MKTHHRLASLLVATALLFAVLHDPFHGEHTGGHAEGGPESVCAFCIFAGGSLWLPPPSSATALLAAWPFGGRSVARPALACSALEEAPFLGRAPPSVET